MKILFKIAIFEKKYAYSVNFLIQKYIQIKRYNLTEK